MVKTERASLCYVISLILFVCASLFIESALASGGWFTWAVFGFFVVSGVTVALLGWSFEKKS